MAMERTFDTLIVARTGWRLDVTLNRPEARNAMNAAMVAELLDLFTAVREDTTLRVLVLRGAGGTFCAGGDLRDMGAAACDDPARTIAALNRSFGRMLEAAEALPQVLVVVAEGAVMGGGFGLACVSDITLAADNTHFAMPEVRLGLIPAQIAPFVVRRIGLPAARRLALTGVKLSAGEAAALGLAHHVEAADALDGRLVEVLEAIRQCAPGAVAATKRLLLSVGAEDLGPTLDEAAEGFAAAALGREAQKGIGAFMSKSPAPWAKEPGA